MPQDTLFLKLKKILKGERNWDTFLNGNFDTLDSEIKAIKDKNDDHDSRINNIVGETGTSNTEIVDARQSIVKDKTFPVLRTRIEENEGEINLSLGLVQSENKNLNTDLGIYTLIEYKDISGKVRLTSELQSLDANNRYAVRELKIYEQDGTTVRKTQQLSLSYDVNGKLYKETAI